VLSGGVYAVVPKVCSADPKGSATSFQEDLWGHSCNGYLEVYLFLIKGLMFC
jgi:hypothetical protein